MIIKDKNKLVSVLKTLWKLWEKDYPNEWPSSSEGIDSNFISFIEYNGKLLGIKDSLEELTFWYSCLTYNENQLYDKVLTVDNVKVPELNNYDVVVKLLEWEKFNSYRNLRISCYLNETDLEESFWTLNYEDFYNIYDATEFNREWIDGENLDESVYSVTKIPKAQQESIEKFIKNPLF